MDTALHAESSDSPSAKWAAYAGLYMFVCGTVVASLLSDLLALLADVIGLPAGYAMAMFASPVLVIGTAVWWLLVERRTAYTYPIGGVFGLITASAAGLLWTARFVDVWGVEMAVIDAVASLIAFVIGVAVVGGVLAGLPMMYARRRLGGGPSDG